MIELPKRDGTMYLIDAIALKALQGDYPRIDVLTELKKMKNWLEANPRNRKRDCHRFIVNWLNRARPQASGSVTRETSNHYALVAERVSKPIEPPRYAPPEVASAHLQDLKKMLGDAPMTVYNRIRPSKDDLALLSALTRKEIAAKYKVAPSTVSKWLSLYQLSAADDSWGGNRKYRHGRRPKLDITQHQRDPGERPTCARCGKVMAKAGVTRNGQQKWRCGKNFQICSTAVFGQASVGGRPRSRLPDTETLAKHLRDGMTFQQIGEMYKVSRQTVANRVWEKGLTGLSAYPRTPRPRSDEPVQQVDITMLGLRQKWTGIEGINGFRFSGMGASYE